MPRYIDADAFEKSARERYCGGCDNINGLRCRACWVDDMLGEVDDAPTVSPDEVRGAGKWLHTSDEFGTYEKCSCCGKEYYCGPIAPFNYCPSCGAKMEVEGDA